MVFYKLEYVCRNLTNDVLQTKLIINDKLTDDIVFPEELINGSYELTMEDCVKLKLECHKNIRWFCQLTLY